MARLPHVIPSLDEVQVDIRGAIAIVRLCRPKKRNAINDGLIAAIAQRFDELPETVHAVVLHGEGDHFCAGLDLGELKDRDAAEGLHHSRSWYYVLRDIEQGRRPVVAALHGAVVGGGGSVRVPKLIGAHRMLDMMLTGRVYKAAEGVSIGMAQYHVPAGEALAKAIELAERIAQNAPMTNYALINGLPRIAEQPADHGFLTESLLAGIAQAAPEAKARVRAFLDGTGPEVKA